MQKSHFNALASATFAGGAYFAAIFALGFGLGIARTAALSAFPHLNDFSAVALEVPIMLAAAWFMCREICARLGVAATVPARATMGLVAFALLMACELAFAFLLFGETPRDYVTQIVQPANTLGLVGQVAFALIPLAQARSVSR
jgi:hypothetical protein